MLSKKLNRRDRQPSYELKKNKEITTNTQFTEMVKPLYQSDNTLTQQHVLDFVTFHKTKFYVELRELAHKEFSSMKIRDLNQQLSTQFAQDLDNHFIKLELMKAEAKNPNSTF
jgi:hypothetical protein